MKYVFKILVILVVIFPLLIKADNTSLENEKESKNKKFTPLIQYIATSNEEYKPGNEYLGTGGNLDQSSFFEVGSVLSVSFCINSVLNVLEEWEKEFSSLRFTKKEIFKRRLLSHISSSDEKGFFEIIYRVNKKFDRTNLLVVFYDESGKHLPIEQIENLQNKYKLTNLATELGKSARCKKNL